MNSPESLSEQDQSISEILGTPCQTVALSPDLTRALVEFYLTDLVSGKEPGLYKPEYIALQRQKMIEDIEQGFYEGIADTNGQLVVVLWNGGSQVGRSMTPIFMHKDFEEKKEVVTRYLTLRSYGFDS